jgi:hypothetical protein
MEYTKRRPNGSTADGRPRQGPAAAPRPEAATMNITTKPQTEPITDHSRPRSSRAVATCRRPLTLAGMLAGMLALPQ